ncbi:MAG TPA: O-antigen ligase family protein [Patescibacteria group bacterium]|nr:O-antigen ligase family protein [Patescibacteria group bacterium]
MAELPGALRLQPRAMTPVLLWLLPFFLPTFLVRFHIWVIPTTLLELYVMVLLVDFSAQFGFLGWKQGWQRLGSWRWPILAWLVASLIGVIAAPDKVAGLGLWRAHVLEPLLVLVTLARMLETSQDVKRLYRSLILVTGVIAAWAVVQFCTGFGIPSPWNVAISAGRRATSFLWYPNAVSLFVAPVGAFAFVRWLRERREHWSLIGWISALAGICVAKSNGGLLAIGAVISIALLLYRKTRAIAFGLATLGALVLALIPSLRMLVWKTATLQEWSGQVRLFQWRETWQMLKDHWFFGAGFGAYPAVFAAYHRAKAIEIFQYPHNILLNVWSETGLLGVFSFFWILGKWIVDAYRNEKGDHLLFFASIAPVIAIVLQGLFDVPYFKNDLAMAFWLLLFICLFWKRKEAAIV